MMLNHKSSHLRYGYYISLITAALTLITFSIAMCTPPLSGPFCSGPCFEYPYTDIAGRFPRDYYWMYPAILLSFSYLVMMITILHQASQDKKLFGTIGVALAIMASLILISDYFIQVSVIQPSLQAGETDGIAILSQFNPHGIFIVLEEMGFLLMTFSFFTLFSIFEGKNPLEITIRWTVIIGSLLAVVSFVLVSFVYGIHREYRFEVIIISITWTELTLLSILLARYFRRKMAKTT